MNEFEGCTGCTQNRTAHSENAGKIFARKHSVISINKTSVSIQKTVNFYLFPAVYQGLYHAAHSCVQCLAVPAACQHSDSNHPFALLYKIYRYLFYHKIYKNKRHGSRSTPFIFYHM